MSQKLECEQCGGQDFNLEDGYYFCSECHLQSQNVQEQVMEDYVGSQKVVTTKVSQAVDEAQSQGSQVKGALSSWELLNYILKGLVDELISLGAPKDLKFVCLQLWASYLKKIEVAFTSTTVKKKPKLGAYPRKRDAALFYKVNSSSSYRVFSSNDDNKQAAKNTSSSDLDTTVRAKKLKLTRSKKSVAQAEYDESGLESSLNTSAASESGASSCSSLGEDRLKYSRRGKEELAAFLRNLENQDDKSKYHWKMVKRFSRTTQHVRPLHVMAILRIGLLLCGCDIHIGDLRRWTEEGYLSLDQPHKLLPSNTHPALGQSMCLFLPKHFSNISKATRSLAKMLGVSKDAVSSTDIILNLVTRYCRMLNLPDCIITGIRCLVNMKPPKMSLLSQISNFEARAMAFILFSLKILLGLDDVTENNYSSREEVDGIKWDEWCRRHVARTAKKAVSHHPTLQRHYPRSFVDRGHAFLSHWDTSDCFLNKDRTGAHQLFKDSLQKTLKPLLCKLPEPTWRPGMKNDLVATGPLLAVLRETDENDACKIKKMRIVRPLAGPTRTKKKAVNRRDLKVKILDDDAVDSSKPQKSLEKEPVKIFEEKLDTEDPKMWLFHSYHFTRGHELTKTFDATAAEILPSSFLWILNEMAELIYQPSGAIYEELVRVEKVYTGDLKTLFHW